MLYFVIRVHGYLTGSYGFGQEKRPMGDEGDVLIAVKRSKRRAVKRAVGGAYVAGAVDQHRREWQRDHRRYREHEGRRDRRRDAARAAVAIGAAAAVAARLIASEVSKDDNDSGASSEASAAQMKACKNAVAEKFVEASMADISVSSKSSGKHGEAEVNWTVDLHGAKTHGFCKVSADGDVVKVTTTGHAGNKHDGEELEQSGFYYDKHVGKWRDPAGDICHTCTPENGFPKP